MASKDRNAALSIDEARARVVATCFSPASEVGSSGDGDAQPRPGRVGLEPELFAFRTGPSGEPAGRVPLQGTPEEPGILEVLDELSGRLPFLKRAPDTPGKPPIFDLGPGGTLTFEPGGQIEHSTAPHDTVAEALEDTHDVFCMLQSAFGKRSIALASLGLDPWSRHEDVPQQHAQARYTSMAAYFDAVGPHGRTMMRLTASQQVNLDLGAGSTLEERWLAAYLAVPLATAAFSTSPQGEWASGRARAWVGIDPTRAGFPAALVDGSLETAGEQYAASVLAADVMLLRRPDGTATTGSPGWTFEDWIRDGHPELGFPTADDLDYHLTTLFFEIRPRGFFEIRSTDALPAPWWKAPVVLWTGLLYDPRARGEVLELLAPLRARLPRAWEDAARRGMHDAELADLARRTWDAALEGARRLPPRYVGDDNLAAAEAFLEEYTRRGRAPSDTLRELADDPRGALHWAIGEAGCSSLA